MKRGIICVLGLMGAIASAQAADLNIDSIKDPLPDTLSWHGVTIYGTVDVGYAYQTNGRPTGGIVSDLEYSPFNATRNFTGQSVSTLQGSGLEQSKIGVKIEEDVGQGFVAIGKLDTGFDPIKGTLSDGCGSIQQNLNVAPAFQNSSGDSSRCGQAFNGVAYGGVSNAAYGTLTIGRQNSLQLDAFGNYDPTSLSYAFSLLGVNGAFAGSGSTEAARWDNSVKYVYEYGPFHAAAMYSNGGSSTGTIDYDYAFNAGFKYKALSIDGIYTRENGAINLANLDGYTGTTLHANISNNEAWTVLGKYTFGFGGGFKDAGYKDPLAGDKLTVYAGYSHISQSDPSGITNGGSYTINGGYDVIANTLAYETNRNLDLYFTGAKYELPSGWSFTGVYYHVDQNAYEAGGRTCYGPNTTVALNNGPAGGSQCAGTYDQGSFVVDYQFSKHFDVYAGITYGRVNDGLAANFQGTPSANSPVAHTAVTGTATSVDTTDVVTGIRLRF